MCLGLFYMLQTIISLTMANHNNTTYVTDHDYGYRQGMVKDPFGHYWQIQKKI
jgi:PhnB protein